MNRKRRFQEKKKTCRTCHDQRTWNKDFKRSAVSNPSAKAVTHKSQRAVHTSENSHLHIIDSEISQISVIVIVTEVWQKISRHAR